MTAVLSCPTILHGETATRVAAGYPTLPIVPETSADDVRDWLTRVVQWEHQPLAVVSNADEETESEILDLCRAHYRHAAINTNTVRENATRQTLNALRRWTTRPRWAGEAGRPLDGCPVFVCGAGVSLERVTHLLPDMARRGAVFAGNTGWAALRHFGVEADVVGACESKPLGWMLDGAPGVKVLDHCAHPSLWEAAGPGALAMSGPESNLVPYVLRMGGQPLHYATACFNALVELAFAWGASMVVLVGQTGGFLDGRLYAAGSPFAHLTYTVQDGMCHFSDPTVRPPMPLLQRQSADGWVDSVDTFTPELAWLSRRAGLPIVNCSEGGALIPGLSHAKLADVLRVLPERDVPAITVPERDDCHSRWSGASVLDDLEARAQSYVVEQPRHIPHGFDMLHMWAGAAMVSGLRGDDFAAYLLDGARAILEVVRGE